MASSSSSPKLYDVFISHRGPDVKQTLAKQLSDLLKTRGCKPFLDREEIEGGDYIQAAIRNGICSSRVQIAIFSKRFAESSWCLDEVDLMLQQTDALFIPLFYGVEPWELRYIDQATDAKAFAEKSQEKSEKMSQYAKAFADYHSKGRYLDRLDKWKRALQSAADIRGYQLGHHQEDMLEEIVSRVVEEVQRKEKSIPLHVAKYPVGLPDLVQDFESCYPKTAGMVGIFGLGGSGKTTLAKELFNRKKMSGYKASSFLSDVRESHARSELHSLQIQLLKDLFSKDEEIRSVDEGIGKLKDRLGRAREWNFLIVVDDIDHQDQLDALLPEGMLGCGSLVIITTRDQSLLKDVDVRYQMKEMDWNRAEELFCSHAFRRRDPPISYQELVQSFLKFCGGLPLSLIVLGAHVYKKDEMYWKLELEKVKKIPPTDIKNRLKISFYGLDIEEKQIFIDIACFFNKKYFEDDLKKKAVKIWKASGWVSGEHALQTLQNKCLIKIRSPYAGREIFEMHDHLRDLGRQMADELGPPRVWQPELLRSMRSMQPNGFKQFLAETKGRCFDDIGHKEITSYFIADTNLLSLEIDRFSIHMDSNLPSWIPLPLRKLHYLSLKGVEDWSIFEEQIETHAQATFELRTLQIWSSPYLLKLPNIIEMFSKLEELEIVGSLQETDTTSFVQSLKQLSNLTSLSLRYTKGGLFRGNLYLSKGRDCSTSSRRMDSLETIELSSLKNIFKLVISEEMCPKLQKLDISWMASLKEIELQQPERINTLSVRECPKLETIMKVGDGNRLEEIEITDCPGLQSVQGMEGLPGLKRIVIQGDYERNGWTRNYIGGLRRLPLEITVLLQRATPKAALFKLNVSKFSKVIEGEGVSEIEKIERGNYTLEMKSSSSEITIYAMLVTPQNRLTYQPILTLESTEYLLDGAFEDVRLIIVVFNQYDGECRLEESKIKEGVKVIVKFGEERKALIVLQRIVDQLYAQRKE